MRRLSHWRDSKGHDSDFNLLNLTLFVLLIIFMDLSNCKPCFIQRNCPANSDVNDSNHWISLKIFLPNCFGIVRSLCSTSLAVQWNNPHSWLVSLSLDSLAYEPHQLSHHYELVIYADSSIWHVGPIQLW